MNNKSNTLYISDFGPNKGTKAFLLIALIVMLVAGCEEIYKPALDVVPGSLVVESHITNDPSQSFVRLSISRDFYSTAAVDFITGAHIELIESGGSYMQALEKSAGYYTFQEIPEVGKKYSLRISYNSDTYESDFMVMPPIPKIDSLYTRDYTEKTYRTNAYNVPELYEATGRQILVDAPLTSDLNHYLFKYQAVIQWYYSLVPGIDSIPVPLPDLPPKSAFLNTLAPPPPADTTLHVLYGWITYTNTDEFNLAGPKEFSASTKLQNHLIKWLDYRGGVYLDSTTQKPVNWIFTLEQYGITKASYDFHAKLNQQFSAEGNLFDPMLTQVSSNIHCVNNPSKIVLGFFDLCSYSRYRYFMNLGSGPNSTLIIRKITKFYDIPNRGFTVDKHPVFWQTNTD